jgi:hypothetical protein
VSAGQSQQTRKIGVSFLLSQLRQDRQHRKEAAARLRPMQQLMERLLCLPIIERRQQLVNVPQVGLRKILLLEIAGKEGVERLPRLAGLLPGELLPARDQFLFC